MNQKKYSLETRIEALELYKKGCSAKEIAETLNITIGIVTYWARTAGITRHRGPKSKIEKEDFFDNIDSEAKAYFLGWIMADGNVSTHNNQYSLKIEIGIDDRIIIDGFLQHIGSTNKASEKPPRYKNHGSYYVSLTSVHMCKSLINLGVIPNKTGRESFPLIPKHLEPHFIRGYFDGDGITCVKNIKRSGFIGPIDLLTKFQNNLKSDLTIFRAKCEIPMYYFQGGVKFSRHLYEYMYSNATLWLPRKKRQLETVCKFENTEITNKDNTLLVS